MFKNEPAVLGGIIGGLIACIIAVGSLLDGKIVLVQISLGISVVSLAISFFFHLSYCWEMKLAKENARDIMLMAFYFSEKECLSVRQRLAEKFESFCQKQLEEQAKLREENVSAEMLIIKTEESQLALKQAKDEYWKFSDLAQRIFGIPKASSYKQDLEPIRGLHKIGD